MVYISSMTNSTGSFDFPAINTTNEYIRIDGRTYSSKNCDHTVKAGETTVHYSNLKDGRVVILEGAGAFTMARGGASSGSINGVSYKHNGERLWVNGKEVDLSGATASAGTTTAEPGTSGTAKQHSPGPLARLLGWLSEA